MNIYNDIALRTNGDIYIGVVGPVRTGKSTFVTSLMEALVIPRIKNKNVKQRVIDELPQSADGTTIMTTQPKFVPNEAIKVTLTNNIEANIRMIDCVGYLIEGANGAVENNKPRLVKTPWSADEMPFEQAAEMGTNKVIFQHSTIAVVLTNDGSITELPRSNYIPAEERVISELKQLDKPFIVVLNSVHPANAETVELAKTMESKYGVAVVPMDVRKMSNTQIEMILSKILYEFPVRKIDMEIPHWMRTLPPTDKYIMQIISNIKTSCNSVNKMKDYQQLIDSFTDTEDFDMPTMQSIQMGEGIIKYSINTKPNLFYRIISEQTGMSIADDISLMRFVVDVAKSKSKYDRINDALNNCQATGYGIVMPDIDELIQEDPEINKQGTRYGVKLRAKAPSLHILRVDISTEVNPIVGSEQQGQYLLSEFQNNPKGIWETNMFGKTMSMLAKDGINNKLMTMSQEVQEKMRKALNRVVNENKSGLICILL